MKIQDWFENWGISGLKLSAGFLQMEWKPQPEEQQAAWELYIELLTRVATQPLPDDAGDEATALESVHDLFGITRALLKENGRKAETFSKVAIIILNQKIRPFTAEWHKKPFNNPNECSRFRQELKEVQTDLRNYAKLLANVADVEDFQSLAQGEMDNL